VRGALSALEMECEAQALAPVAAGDVPTIGQLTIGCVLGYLDFRYASEAWRERHKRLGAWYEDFAKRRAMQQTVPKDAG
jgi:glutathione S-transferase